MSFQKSLLLVVCLRVSMQAWADDKLFERANTAAQQGGMGLFGLQPIFFGFGFHF